MTTTHHLHPIRPPLGGVLIDEATLAARISELGRTISSDYAGTSIVVIGILRGAFMFLTDLVRQITVPMEIDFMAISSYGTSTRSSGVVRILKDLDEPLEGRHVVVVEDIVDTGLTLSYLLDVLEARDPASLRICCLLDKVVCRQVPVTVHYVGFEIPDRFVVGYGLDYEQQYRNLPYVATLAREGTPSRGDEGHLQGGVDEA